MVQREYNDVGDAEIEYQNKFTRIIVLRDVPEMDLAGKHISSTSPGGELEVPHWAAEEMTRRGYAKYREKEELTLQELSKIHWRETIPSPRNLPNLEEEFYCKLRRLLRDQKNQGGKDLDKLKDHEKTLSISNEIVNCRLKKIAMLAASQYRSGEIIKNLTAEEKVLLNKIVQAIDEWKTTVMEEKQYGKSPREP